MDIENIKEDLVPILNNHFSWKVDFIDNQNGPMLFILDYSDDTENVASFALSLSEYSADKFPRKCWMTNKKVRKIDGGMPNSESGKQYEGFTYQDQIFYPFSVDLSEYKKDDIKIIIKSLYRHIDWS